MRLFIAICFEKRVLDALTELQEDMKYSGVKGNYTKEENLHLTLAFIGEFGNPEAVADALEQISFEPFTMRLDSMGNYRDLFWVGIEENRELSILVKRIRRALSDNGIPFDRKRFSPHITIVRRAYGRDINEIQLHDLPSEEIKVASISLMRSERGKHGMIYTEIGSFGRKVCAACRM